MAAIHRPFSHSYQELGAFFQARSKFYGFPFQSPAHHFLGTPNPDSETQPAKVQVVVLTSRRGIAPPTSEAHRRAPILFTEVSTTTPVP